MSNEKSPFIVEGKLADNERLKREIGRAHV